MARRKRRRFRRPAVRTLAEFASREFDYGIQSEVKSWLDFIFGGDETAAHNFWQTYQNEFCTMRRKGDARELWNIHHKPGRRHPLWWAFAASEPPQFDSIYGTAEIEFGQLERLGEIRAEEIEALTAEAIETDKKMHANPWHSCTPFRRSWQWWRFVSSAPRDDSLLEAAQLCKLGVLTSLEKAILADPHKAVTSGVTCSGRTRFYYLARAERELLGLTEFHNDYEADGTLPAADLSFSQE
jgi:hypothetical protein